MKLLNRKSFVIIVILCCILAGNIAFRAPDPEKPEFTNLRVLSKNITDEKMDQIMHTFNNELGVYCTYCHDADLSGPIPKSDFANDRNPKKRIARDMLKMTMNLNRKYFDTKVNSRMTVQVRVWCATCHHGLPIPFLPNKKTGK